jgi:hypothetical protein
MGNPLDLTTMMGAQTSLAARKILSYIKLEKKRELNY